MDSVTIALTPPAPVVGGLTRFSLIRIVLAVLAVCLPVALVLVLVHQIPDKAMRAFWPPLLAAMVGLGGYLFYLRKVEKRAATEFLGAGAGREVGAGLLLGTLLFLVTIGVLAACGSFHLTGTGSLTGMAKSFTEMVLVVLIEEILFRGVLFRLSERSLGTWAALAISSVVFALAHMPNADITALAIANTVVAGLMFAAAYLATRRLWLAIGLHFAQNFVPDGVFSLPTSGNPGRGFLQGQLSGPDWLAGGAYGVEASAVTLIVMSLAAALLLRHAIRAGHIAPRPGLRKAHP
jgi:membrane protease YdiL (CAAX protease family)